MAVEAIYFDGQSAKDRAVSVSVSERNLIFSGPEVNPVTWSIAGLHPLDPPALGQPFRLTHDDKPGARLVLRDQALINSLITLSPHLKGGYSKRDVSSIFGWTIGGLLLVAGLAYVTLTLLPDQVAHLLPDQWRNRVGKQMEQALVSGARVCSTSAGDAAIGAMIANLAQGAPDMPPIAVHVYDIPILNAFAVPGGSIILTRELIAQADAPEEVAGVLAHEIGHVYHLHPEAQLVRLTGMQVLTSLVTGSNGGNTTSNLAFLATFLRYSRDAEAEADSYARETLTQSSIDPMGLKRFFEKVLKIESAMKLDNGPFKVLGSIFSTHPGTEDRIKEIQSLPAGQTAVPALTAEQWKALQGICAG